MPDPSSGPCLHGHRDGTRPRDAAGLEVPQERYYECSLLSLFTPYALSYSDKYFDEFSL